MRVFEEAECNNHNQGLNKLYKIGFHQVHLSKDSRKTRTLQRPDFRNPIGISTGYWILISGNVLGRYREVISYLLYVIKLSSKL